VSTPITSRIALKTVKTFARTMLAVERLVAGGSTGPRSARRRSASASVRPVGFAAVGSVPVVLRGYRSSPATCQTKPRCSTVRSIN
jgi:hypothetical protein